MMLVAGMLTEALLGTEGEGVTEILKLRGTPVPIPDAWVYSFVMVDETR